VVVVLVVLVHLILLIPELDLQAQVVADTVVQDEQLQLQVLALIVQVVEEVAPTDHGVTVVRAAVAEAE
jgi:hypothetical protein